MNWTNALIFLAPRILNNRKPLEYSSFIGLYTSIKDKYSKGFLYLVYDYSNIREIKEVEGLLNNLKYYYNSQLLYVNNKYFIIFSFYFSKDNNIIEEYKEHGNIGFTMFDYTPLITFWGDRNSEIKDIYTTDIFKCKNELNEERLS